MGDAVQFHFPHSLAISPDGSAPLSVTESINDKIRRVEVATGAVTTLAGCGACGSVDGLLQAAQTTSQRPYLADQKLAQPPPGSGALRRRHRRFEWLDAPNDRRRTRTQAAGPTSAEKRRGRGARSRTRKTATALQRCGRRPACHPGVVRFLSFFCDFVTSVHRDNSTGPDHKSALPRRTAARICLYVVLSPLVLVL